MLAESIERTYLVPNSQTMQKTRRREVKVEVEKLKPETREHICSLIEIQCRNDRGEGPIGDFCSQNHAKEKHP